jgi:hypothetical protein
MENEGKTMQSQKKGLRINWFWGLIGLLGILGFILKEPAYFAFFSFFSFFSGTRNPKIQRQEERLN